MGKYMTKIKTKITMENFQNYSEATREQSSTPPSGGRPGVGGRKESNQEKLKSIKNSNQGLDGLKFKSFFTQHQSILEPQTKTTDHQNSSSIDPTHSTTDQSR